MPDESINSIGWRSAVAAPTSEIWMQRALALAAHGIGYTHPNPMVGCVLVRQGKVVGEGFHLGPGTAHAEVAAISDAARRGNSVVGATAFVTLEPCNHVGQTGKCTDALIAAKVARVVAAMPDPNPAVAGGGLARLRRAGIKVETGLLRAESETLNQAWMHWLRTGRPFVTLKAAMSLDGRIATASGDSRWLSSAPSRQFAHRLRQAADAILVGRHTVQTDRPRLTTRLPKSELPAGQKPKNPLRVVLDSRLTGPLDWAGLRGAVIFTTARSSLGARQRFEQAGAAVVVMPADAAGRPALAAVLRWLGRLNIVHLLVEGGGTVSGAVVAKNLANRVILFAAPVWLGSSATPVVNWRGPSKVARAPRLKLERLESIGKDALLVLAPEQTRQR